MAELVLGAEYDKYRTEPKRNPLRLTAMDMNNYRPTKEEAREEWERNKDKSWLDKTTDFVKGMGNAGEYFEQTWAPAWNEDQSIFKGLVRGDKDAFSSVVGMVDIGNRDLYRMASMAVEGMLEPDTLTDDEKFENHFKRQNEFYDYFFDVREHMAEAYGKGKYNYDVKAGADFGDVTTFLPSFGIFSKTLTGGARGAIKTGAKGVEYGARGIELGSSALNKVARFPRKITGSTPWTLVQTVGGSAFITGSGGALAAAPAVLGLTELLTKASMKVNKSVADIAKVFAQPSSHERFLFRLAKDANVSPRIRKLATKAYKLQGTKMYDVAFDALIAGTSTATLQAAIQYAAGFDDQQAGMAAGTGFALSSPIGAIAGPRGSGKDPNVVDAQGNATRRTKTGVKEYLKRKNDTLNKESLDKLVKESPKSAALLTTLDAMAPMEGLKIDILDLNEFTEYLNNLSGGSMKTEDAPAAHYNRDLSHIIINENEMAAGIDEAAHIFAHELGHHFIKQKLGEDAVSRRLLLEPYMDDEGQEFFFLDKDGNKIPGMLPVTLNQDAVKFAKNYADRIREADPAQAKLIEQDAGLLADEIGAENFAQYFKENPNVFSMYQPSIRGHLKGIMVGAQRKALSRLGLVNEKTGESIAISPDMKVPKEVEQMYKNYIKESQELVQERADAVDKGRKVYPKNGQTSDARFKDLFGGMSWNVGAGNAFRIKSDEEFQRLKAIVERETKDVTQKNTGLGRDGSNQNLSAGVIDFLMKNSLNPDQTKAIIDWFQRHIDNRMRVIFGYRGSDKKKWSDYNPFEQKNVTLFGWTWGRKEPGTNKNKETGEKVRVYPNLQVRGYDYDIIVNNITAMAQAGLLGKWNGNVQKFADDLMAHSKKAFKKLGPEDPINPQGIGENELYAMAFGIDQLTVESLKNPQNKQFWSQRKDRGIRRAIKQYDVGALAGIASTGKDGFALDYYNVRDNYFPSATQGFNKNNPDNLSVLYIKGEKFMGKQFASPFEQKFIDSKQVYFGGRFFDVKSGKDVTGKTYTGMQIGSNKVVTPKGEMSRPYFDVSNIETELPTANSKLVGPQIRVNLIDGRNVSTGNKYKWLKKFKDIDNEWLVSFDSEQIKDLHPEDYAKVKHAFALAGEAQVPVKLNTLANEDAFYGPNSKRAGQLKSNPRGRPIMKGEIELGPIVGEIEMNGRLRPVYEKVTIRPKEGNEKYYMPKSPDHGLLGVVDDGEILYSKAGDLWMMNHHRRSIREPEGHSWRYREGEQTVYWWENKPSEVDKESVAAHLERKGYKVKRNKVLDAKSPTFAKDYEASHAFPLMEPPKKGSYMPQAFAGTPRTIRPEPEKGLPYGRFSTKFIGSGEGKYRGKENAQGFGWGLYFADDQTVANWYRETYSQALYDGAGYNRNNPMHEAAKWLAEYTRDGARDRASAMSTLEIIGKDPKSKEGRIRRVLQEGSEAKITYSGNLYEVKLAPTEAELIKWDTPFSKQHPEVQKKFMQLTDMDFLKPWLEKDSTGGELYIELSKRNGYKDYEGASKELGAVGIKGNKYKDGPSRINPNNDNPKFNYVIWDDEDVQIVRKHYMPKKAKKSKPRKIDGLTKSQVRALSAQGKDANAVNIGVAALRNQVLRDMPMAQQMAEQQYHTSFMTFNKNVVKAIGATLVQHDPVIGGWKDSENSVLNRENSHRLAVKFAYPHQAELYAALVGSLAPEVQDSVLMTQPKAKGEDHSVTIDLAPGRGDDITQLEFLDKYNLAGGFTYDRANNKLIFDIYTKEQATGYADVQKLYQDLSARGDATAITSFRASVGFPKVSDYKRALSPSRLSRYYQGETWRDLHNLASQARDRLKYNPRKASVEHIRTASPPRNITLEGEKDGRAISHPALELETKPVFLDKNFISRDMSKMQARGWNQFIEVNAEADRIQMNMSDAGLGPKNWPKIIGLRSNFSGTTTLPEHPSTLFRWVQNRQEFQDFWTSKVQEDPAYLDSAMKGLKSLEPNYAKAQAGELPDMMVALNTIWGVFSISADPTSQESGWGAFTNDKVAMEAVWDSVNGRFKMSKDNWKKIVAGFLKSSDKGGAQADIYELVPSGQGAYGQMPKLHKKAERPFAGNSVTMNANSTWNTLTKLNGRWDEFTGMLNDSSMSGSQIRDAFFQSGFGGASIGPKILSFIISTLGRNDLAIIDRWQLINFWSDFLHAQQPKGVDIFTYQEDGTPVEKTNFYDNYAQMIAGNRTMGQAVHKAIEAGMARIISDNKSFLDPFYAKYGLQPSVFGLHWPLWNFKKKEAVGHSSLDVTQKFLLNNQFPTTDAQFPVFQQQFANEPKFTDEVKRLPQSDPTAPAKRIRRRHIIDKAGAKPRVVEGPYF